MILWARSFAPTIIASIGVYSPNPSFNRMSYFPAYYCEEDADPMQQSVSFDTSSVSLAADSFPSRGSP